MSVDNQLVMRTLKNGLLQETKNIMVNNLVKAIPCCDMHELTDIAILLPYIIDTLSLAMNGTTSALYDIKEMFEVDTSKCASSYEELTSLKSYATEKYFEIRSAYTKYFSKIKALQNINDYSVIYRLTDDPKYRENFFRG